MIIETISYLNQVVMTGDLRDFEISKWAFLLAHLAQARRG